MILSSSTATLVNTAVQRMMEAEKREDSKGTKKGKGGKCKERKLGLVNRKRPKKWENVSRDRTEVNENRKLELNK
jgi:hypothetical protein